MAQTGQTEYTPGVCNIGGAEIARRRNLGWIMLIITIALLAVMIWYKVNTWWRILHFCSGFANKGVYNFGTPGTVQQVTDEASREKDRRRGNQISLYAAIIGAGVAIISLVF
jgi:hypothetical protein